MGGAICYHPPMLRIALTLATVLLTLLSLPAHADITGKPRVVDGDTIHIGKTKIRLHGIDAPEMDEIAGELLG